MKFKVKKLFFESVDGVRLAGKIYIPKVKVKPLPTVCFCHGIPSPVRLKKDKGYAGLAEKFVKYGFIVLIFNFRGTGFSNGNFTFLGWVKDLKSVINFLCSREDVDKERLAVVGFSGGAIVSNYVVAVDKRVKALVLGACPTYTRKTVGNLVKVIVESGKLGSLRGLSKQYTEKMLRKELLRITPTKWIGKVSPRPILIIHGEKDEVVGLEHAYKLYLKAKKPKKLEIIPGASHRLRLSDKAVKKILGWLKQVFQV